MSPAWRSHSRSDGLNLDLTAERQSCGLVDRSGGSLSLREKACIVVIHLAEVAQIRESKIDINDIGSRKACGFIDPEYVAKGALRLLMRSPSQIGLVGTDR